MKKLILSLVFVATTLFVTAQTTWKSDPNHSRLAFTIIHSAINDVTGSFDKFSVLIVSSQPDFSDAKVTLTADVTSVNTHVEMRDNHLRSADFFDVERFPKMSFESKS